MQNEPTITSFYKFHPIADPAKLKSLIEQAAADIDTKGLILVGEEGVNGSVCLQKKHVHQFQSFLEGLFGPIFFKDSPGIPTAFEKLKVRVKPEIVTMGTPELRPYQGEGHIGPQEWHQKLQDQNTQVLDVRNDYEIRIGKFKNAMDLNIEDFSAFPEQLRKSDLDKTRDTLIYCTGGIRCEKAILEMKRQGFQNVSQLNGGILNYLSAYGAKGDYEGECFVFDYRVAVDPELHPSQRFRLCPHCGEPADNLINCRMCGTQKVVCEICLSENEHRQTCSKNCAHHSRMGHKSTHPPSDPA